MLAFERMVERILTSTTEKKVLGQKQDKLSRFGNESSRKRKQKITSSDKDDDNNDDKGIVDVEKSVVEKKISIGVFICVKVASERADWRKVVVEIMNNIGSSTEC